MKIILRSVLLFVVFAMGLYGCGGGGDDSPPATSTPPPSTVGDVTIDKLAGSWFGTYESGTPALGNLQLTFSADGKTVTVNSVDGTQSDLAGPVTKDGPTSFRFTLNSPGPNGEPGLGAQVNSGMLLVNQLASYLIFVGDTSGGKEFGVLQKNAAAPAQSHSQADLNGTWTGYTATAGATFASLQPAVSNASCAPASASAPAGPTACTATLSGRTRSVPSYTLNDPAGRWQGNFTDTPQASGTTQAYISQDRNFIGVWACVDETTFPVSCDYSAWTK